MVMHDLATAQSLSTACPLRAGPSLDAKTFESIRREMMLRACKWDPQVGDVCTIAPFPLLVAAAEWRRLAELAECLAAELEACEAELVSCPELFRRLALPRRLRRLFAERALRATPQPPCPVRVLRFDFHWTRDGWRISEVNSDVPGGFTESSVLPARIAMQFPGYRPAGEPAIILADAIAAAAGNDRHAALLAAAGYMEDLQVVRYLQSLLAARGVNGHLLNPQQLDWFDGRAMMRTQWRTGPVDIIIRFYQAEWLSVLHRFPTLRHFVSGSATPIINPLSAALTESKRFPLVWDQLQTPVPTWRSLLMETRDPRHAPRQDDGWISKSAFCNNGDDVAIPGMLRASQRRRVKWETLLRPRQWIAQRRFEAEAIETGIGPVFPCLGIYTINGKASGVYGRCASRPLIDFQAMDVAVLVEEER